MVANWEDTIGKSCFKSGRLQRRQLDTKPCILIEMITFRPEFRHAGLMILPSAFALHFYERHGVIFEKNTV